MNLNNIVQFRLSKNNLPSHKADDRYWFSTLSPDNFKKNISQIEEVIYYHNQDLEWEGTPSVSEVQERLDFGSQCHLWM